MYNIGDDVNVSKADTVFFLPVTVDYVEQIIKRERPDGMYFPLNFVLFLS